MPAYEAAEFTTGGTTDEPPANRRQITGVESALKQQEAKVDL